MPAGFFPASTMVGKLPQSRIPKCGECGLLKACRSPKIEVAGKGGRGILLVGEAPGAAEDRKGSFLYGSAAQYLRQSLAQVGIDMEEDCWLTDALICRPEKDETPSDKRIDCCRPNLVNTIEKLQPNVIIPLGWIAVKSLLRWLWRSDVGNSIVQWIGWQIPCHKPNAWICPTWHPSFLLRSEVQGTMRKNEVAEMLFLRHLEAAVEKNTKPWPDGPPNYLAQVERIYDPAVAARSIRRFIKKGGLAAFDYETNMLKPDSSKAEIVSCSICWEGRRTIAFPWLGEVIPAMREFILARSIRKVASNLKFEDRWSRRVFGRPVRNWAWCTMNGAHVLDNRKGITSIKFQSFVLLGAQSYDDHISNFLQAKGSMTVNQIINEIELGQLLDYNGLDSLLEYEVAIRQAPQIGYALTGDQE